VQVRAGRIASVICQADDLSGFNLLPYLHIDLGQVGVDRFEGRRTHLVFNADMHAIRVLVGMTRHAYPPIGGGVDIIAMVGIEIDALVPGRPNCLYNSGNSPKRRLMIRLSTGQRRVT